MKDTSVVILAAGESSRFFPYNSFGNKALVRVGGKTIFSQTLESIQKAGLQKVIVIEGPEKPLSSTFSEIPGLDVIFLTQEKALGMGNALLLAKPYVSESFYVTSAYHFDFDLFFNDFEEAKKKDSDIVILTKEDNDLSQFGGVTKENGRVKVEEKKDAKVGQRIISLYLLNNMFLETLEETISHHYNFEDALSSYSAGDIVILETKRETLSLKFPWDLLSVKSFILQRLENNISKKAFISKEANISGNVYIEDGAKILPGAVIIGPVYIGKNAYIGTNAIVRGESCIEEDVVIGAGMEVKNSLIMKGSTTHSGFIGDSVVGENTKIAAGFITGNVRLDRAEVTALVKDEKVKTRHKNVGVLLGSNCALGIHTGTMPGVIIGNNVTVGPATIVMNNIDSNSRYYAEFKQIIKK